MKVYVLNVDTGVRYEDHALPAVQMDAKTLAKRKEGNPNVKATVGWTAERGSEADLNDLPAGNYGIVVDVYYHGINKESFTSSTSFEHQPMGGEATVPPINPDGLYIAGIDNWSGMTFSAGKGCVVPVTGYLFSDEAYVLQAAACQVDEDIRVGKISLGSIYWQSDRASAQAGRKLLEDEYGTTIGKKYQGGFAYAIPSKIVQQLADGRHQVNLTLTLKGPDGDLQYVSLDTVIQVSQEGGTEVKDIKKFANEYCK